MLAIVKEGIHAAKNNPEYTNEQYESDMSRKSLYNDAVLDGYIE